MLYLCLDARNALFVVSLCVKMGTKVRQNKSFGTLFFEFCIIFSDV